MGIISIEQADRLYWLGRYTDRVYTTLIFFAKAYDELIDKEAYSYKELCRDLDIPDIYEGREDFIKRYPYDETNPDSVISNLNRAYDNAIELRDSIGSECLAYIQLAIYEMKKASVSKAPMIEIMRVKDYILAFYGVVDDQIDNDKIRNIVKAGKRIERLDIYARLGAPAKLLRREVHRMIPRVQQSGLDYEEQKLTEIQSLVNENEIDYYKIVSIVESIF